MTLNIGMTTEELRKVTQSDAKKQLRNLDGKVEGLSSRISTLKINLKDAIVNLEKNLKERNVLVLSIANDEDLLRIRKYLAGLVDAEKYESFSTNGDGAISGKTTCVILVAGKRKSKYNMGRYTVKIDPTSNSSPVSIEGENTIVDGRAKYCHPHVHNGDPCLGNVDEDICTYVAKKEFGVVFEMIYDFLKSYTTTGGFRAHRPISTWAKFKDKQLVQEGRAPDTDGYFVQMAQREEARNARREERRTRPTRVRVNPPEVSSSRAGRAAQEAVEASAAETRIDIDFCRELLTNGIDPASLTGYEVTRCRQVKRSQRDYRRKYNFYMRWVTRRRRQG